ncbi:MAG: hypothetical protein PHY72_02890 [Candidatus Pacebacteria bacterium]|nr:hypothetical protein [Candidatus Paceibacterota bacterium]
MQNHYVAVHNNDGTVSIFLPSDFEKNIIVLTNISLTTKDVPEKFKNLPNEEELKKELWHEENYRIGETEKCLPINGVGGP